MCWKVLMSGISFWRSTNLKISFQRNTKVHQNKPKENSSKLTWFRKNLDALNILWFSPLYLLHPQHLHRLAQKFREHYSNWSTCVEFQKNQQSKTNNGLSIEARYQSDKIHPFHFQWRHIAIAVVRNYILCDASRSSLKCQWLHWNTIK